MSQQTFADEPGHITELRRQLRRFVEDNAPREKRRQWDREHTFPRDLLGMPIVGGSSDMQRNNLAGIWRLGRG